MKKIFKTHYYGAYADSWLLLLRVGIAGAMLTHGYPKLLKIMEGNFQFADPIGIGAPASLVLAAFAEFLCSILLLMGLATRLAAIPLLINMLVIILIQHGSDPFGKKELPLLYLLGYGTLLVFGGGKYSLDSVLMNRFERPSVKSSE
jgi:putative oxidoreductase